MELEEDLHLHTWEPLPRGAAPDPYHVVAMPKTQCEKNPMCTRGYEHRGRGGQCNNQVEWAARLSKEAAAAGRPPPARKPHVSAPPPRRPSTDSEEDVVEMRGKGMPVKFDPQLARERPGMRGNPLVHPGTPRDPIAPTPAPPLLPPDGPITPLLLAPALRPVRAPPAVRARLEARRARRQVRAAHLERPAVTNRMPRSP